MLCLRELINRSPDRYTSLYPDSNLIYVNEDNCLDETMDYAVNDLVSFGSCLTVMKFQDPELKLDRNFGRNNPELMQNCFKQGSLAADQVRYLGAARRFAKPEALSQLVASPKNEEMISGDTMSVKQGQANAWTATENNWSQQLTQETCTGH